MDTAQYTDLFISEAQDHLQEMSRALLAIEDARRSKALGTESEQIARLFRAAHTLKGMSATLGFQQIASLAHHMEDVFDLLRQKRRDLTPDLADVLFSCLDRLGSLVEQIAATSRESGDVSRELALLEKILQAPPENVAQSLPTEPGPPAPPPHWEIRVLIAADCQLKGPRAFVVTQRLSRLSNLVKCLPAETELHAGNYEDSFSLFFGADANLQALNQAAERVAEVVSVSVISVHLPEDTPIEQLSKSLSQTIPAPTGSSLTAEKAPALIPPVAAPVLAETTPGTTEEIAAQHIAGSKIPPQPKQDAPASETEIAVTLVRLKVSLLDQLLDAAADMVVNHSLLMQISRKHDLPDLKEGLEGHAAAIKRLEQVVLSMRMTPVSQVFNRFPRLIRDMARDLEKDVRFEMEGAEIELDRMILERLTDPLVHLLRNAVDHGIESTAERTRTGKPLPATIRLVARREQNKAFIEVSDDGRGLSPDTILRVAIERGVITSRQAKGLDQAAILDLISLPGFSTKTQVSDLSGRGVGMDVVKRTLHEMGGGLEIESQAGRGSLFRLTCPLTMAILPAILVRSGVERYAIPLTHIAYTLEPQAAELRWLYNQAMLPRQEGLLPLFSLGQFLGTPGAEPILRLAEPETYDGDEDRDPQEERNQEIGDDTPAKVDLPSREMLIEVNQTNSQPLQVIVVQRGRQTYGLVVDEILGKEDIVLKPLSKYLGTVTGLSGVTLRGEGEIVLVLDVAGMVQTMAANGKGGMNG